MPCRSKRRSAATTVESDRRFRSFRIEPEFDLHGVHARNVVVVRESYEERLPPWHLPCLLTGATREIAAIAAHDEISATRAHTEVAESCTSPFPTPGSIVWIRRRRWRVESARRDRSVVRLDVADRERRLTFLAPFDRPSSSKQRRRPRRAHVREAAARLAGLVARAPTARGLHAALDASVDILPYQLEPALAVVDGVRRLLVADEVGLGKTIQAALAIAELRRRRPVLRAMVIVPRSLRDQWRDELNERFGSERRSPTAKVSMRPRARSGHGRSPWTRAGVWVVSADYLKQPHVFDAIPRLPWDIVVIDEAHDACGDSARHEAADEMARRARHVLLLTATPHVGDATRFAAARGPRSARRASTIRWPRSGERRASLGQPSTRRVRWSTVALTRAERRVLDALAAFERAVMAAAPSASAMARCSCFQSFASARCRR